MTKDKKSSFEEELKKLSELVSSLENQDQDLDESIKTYKTAVELCQKLTSMLSQAEALIESISISPDGTAKHSPLTGFSKPKKKGSSLSDFEDEDPQDLEDEDPQDLEDDDYEDPLDFEYEDDQYDEDEDADYISLEDDEDPDDFEPSR
ncbi:MAG: exodeoxyribonuclease VII small subunit [Deltaproteobacteria bacterium]|jgi:exodeoxyribonuclease VII small subunit|nr:exodeoxyribonuclease VII small subunit [Deltaproteobacteria bacterium]